MNFFLPFPGIDLQKYLADLAANAAPQWGKMRGQHMVEHLALPLRISVGDFPVQIYTPSDRVEKMKTVFLMGDAFLRRDFKLPLIGDEPMPLIHESMPEAI